MRPKLADLLEMTEEEFREKFRKSRVKRAKWRGLVRNVAAYRVQAIENRQTH